MARILTITTLLLVGLTFFTLSSYAHIYMLESYPSPESSHTTPPKKVTLTFVGSLEPAFSKIEVFDRSGKKVSGKTTFRDDDTVMETELKENLPPGKYTVKWKCMSLDGHLQKDQYIFYIK